VVPGRGLTVAAPDGVTGDYVTAIAGPAAGELGVRPPSYQRRDPARIAGRPRGSERAMHVLTRRNVIKFGAVLFAIVALSWMWRGCGFNNTVYRLGSVNEAAELTRLRFPRGSTLVAGSVRRGWVPGLWAVMTMPVGGANEFFEQPIRNRQGPDLGVKSPSEIFLAWGGLPHSPERDYEASMARIQRFRYVQGGDLYKEGSVQILMDCDSADERIVYVSWGHD
jgi:hypothetical protein